MPTQSPVFAQVTRALDPREFARCVARFPMRRSSRSFSAYDHFLALCFGQLTFRESLRDIIACLNARANLKYHLGLRGRITRTNFAYSNRHRDWRVFAAVAEVLIRRATRLYSESPADPDFSQIVLALDASIIHLSLKIFPWAYWGRSRSGALKLHTLLSIRGNLPVWASLTEAAFPEAKTLDQVPVYPGAFYVMDRAYLDFSRLVRFDQGGANFVVRSRVDVKFSVVDWRPVDKSLGLRCDQRIRFKTSWSKKHYPQTLRRIRFQDESLNHSLVFLTNNFELPAIVICQLYKQRWQVELFFKWIKQHLRIRQFFGHSANAIHCQVWSAICTYLLVAITKKELRLDRSLYEILQILSVNAFEQTSLSELLAQNTTPPELCESQNTPYLPGFLTGH